MALEQASTFSESVEFLSTLASVVLLSVAGAMCLTIGVLMVRAKRRIRELVPADD